MKSMQGDYRSSGRPAKKHSDETLEIEISSKYTLQISRSPGTKHKTQKPIRPILKETLTFLTSGHKKAQIQKNLIGFNLFE